jgi:hypothetical protein
VFLRLDLFNVKLCLALYGGVRFFMKYELLRSFLGAFDNFSIIRKLKAFQFSYKKAPIIPKALNI